MDRVPSTTCPFEGMDGYRKGTDRVRGSLSQGDTPGWDPGFSHPQSTQVGSIATVRAVVDLPLVAGGETMGTRNPGEIAIDLSRSSPKVSIAVPRGTRPSPLRGTRSIRPYHRGISNHEGSVFYNRCRGRSRPPVPPRPSTTQCETIRCCPPGGSPSTPVEDESFLSLPVLCASRPIPPSHGFRFTSIGFRKGL